MPLADEYIVWLARSDIGVEDQQVKTPEIKTEVNIPAIMLRSMLISPVLNDYESSDSIWRY